MKIMKYISLVLAMALTVSCEKHVVEYDATTIGDVAEFQLHYMNPVAAVAANYITKVEVNGKMVANATAPLNTYNAIPSGAAGRFYKVNPGNVNLKLYLKAKLEPKGDSLVYDQSVTMQAGKQNVFVHDFVQPLVWFDNGYPYIKRETVTTDSTAWIRFYNFLYETAGVPTTKLIQYQYVNTRTNAAVNIGEPVAFGEATDWKQVTVIKAAPLDVSRTITFKMLEVDADGNIIGPLQIMNTGGTYDVYSATASLTIGRWYHHIMAGYRAVKSPNSSVRVFTAL